MLNSELTDKHDFASLSSLVHTHPLDSQWDKVYYNIANFSFTEVTRWIDFNVFVITLIKAGNQFILGI